ncbi:MAG: SurA N-terminal domain-containing protein [Deltaproteobacteria bacterium]|nr:SurA N-terminal domain-containing protein [Deltaproteobacteria bacterium]
MKRAMVKRLFGVFMLGLFLSFSACGNQQEENGEVLAKINDFQMTLKEFKTQLAANLEFEKDFKLTREAKEEFLNSLIQKELLIQEALKLKLERKKKFIEAIERYWEATLIKNLMELKGKEISATTYVSEEEIQARYDKMKKSNPDLPPLVDMRTQLQDKIKREQKTRDLAKWIEDLRKSAVIEIDQKLLSEN